MPRSKYRNFERVLANNNELFDVFQLQLMIWVTWSQNGRQWRGKKKDAVNINFWHIYLLQFALSLTFITFFGKLRDFKSAAWGV